MGTNQEVETALGNEYDGVDKFELVKEILHLQAELGLFKEESRKQFFVAEKLRTENKMIEKALKILSPYHGKTNPCGRLEAIEHSIEFIENNFVKHDTADISSCARCNAVSLARWMADIIKILKGK